MYTKINIVNDEVSGISIKKTDIIIPTEDKTFEIREGGELEGLGYFLDWEYYDYVITKDRDGAIVLLQLRKGALNV